MKRLPLAVLLVLAPLAVQAETVSHLFLSSRCDNDTDPIPSFASGRDTTDGCLLIDPDGSGPLGRIPFDWEATDKLDTVPPRCDEGPGTLVTHRDCSAVIWGTEDNPIEIDDFLNPPTDDHKASEDVVHMAGRTYKNILYMHGGMGNTFKCGGTNSWVGPPGSYPTVDCSGGGTTRHSDAIQITCQPVDDGTVAYIDWKFVNVNDIHYIFEIGQCSPKGATLGLNGHPTVVFQGVEVGFEDGYGILAPGASWIPECIAMGDTNCGVGSGDRWIIGSNNSGGYIDTTWLINSYSKMDATNHSVGLQMSRVQKVVIVNGGTRGPCDNFNGCDGVDGVGFWHGWPAPMGDFYMDDIGGVTDPRPADGPGVCPDGLISADLIPVESIVTRVYCFNSIEAALAKPFSAGPAVGSCPDCPLTQPNFIHLFESGWVTPPNPSSGPALSMTLSTNPNPAEKGDTFTFSAVGTGGNGTYTKVEFDCDGDTAYDDGTDLSIPFSVVCPAFSTIGTKSIGARITDSSVTTGTKSFTLLVVPNCGDGDVDGTETCDPGPPANLGDPDFDECDEHGLSGAGIACESDCSDYDLSGCTVPATCPNAICSGGESVSSCFEDCPSVTPVVATGETPSGWAIGDDDLDDEPDINIAVYSDSHWSVQAFVDPAVISVLFIVNGNRNDPRSGFVNTGLLPSFDPFKLFVLCGVTDAPPPSTIPTECSVSNGWVNGDYTVEVVPCSGFWSTSNQNTGCTDLGGKIGPSRTINFTVKDIQSP